MRLSLDALERMDVNYVAIPFGFDQSGKGIYSAQNGKIYLGSQDWLPDCKAQLTFLRTKALISHVLIRAFSTTNLIVLDLDAACDLFPIEVPLSFDKRAAADRPGKLKISALAGEICHCHIAGTKPRSKTFQRAKGLNGLEDRDVFIIPTCIPPEQYAELNVVGQWLEIPNVVSLFYEDQISQAVGRNRGFGGLGSPPRRRSSLQVGWQRRLAEVLPTQPSSNSAGAYKAKALVRERVSQRT